MGGLDLGIIRAIKSKRIRWTGYVKHMGGPRFRQNNTKMDLKEIWCEDLYWIHLAQDRIQWWVLVNTIMNHWVPDKAGDVHDHLNS
jgi:hypothetical protein